MKPWKLIPYLKFKKLLKRQQGQSIVEFVLLLLVVTSISYAFVGIVNRNIAIYWEYSVNLIINDKPGEKTVNFKN